MDERDVIFVVGLVLLSVGCGWVYPPFGLMVPGLVLVGLAVATAFRRGTPRRRPRGASFVRLPDASRDDVA